jgi:phage FluMu gp28-like protein
VLAKARFHCEVLARLGYRGATDYARDNTEEIAWKSGGRIVALPANPRTARSYSGDTWLDEFAYHSDPEAIRDGVFPMATRGNWVLRILSTPNGAQGLFYDWTATTPPGWSIHQVTIDDAIRDGYAVDLDKLWQLCGGDERLFAQWYRCRFLDADLQYLPTKMVDRAFGWQGNMPGLEDAEVFAGLDVGRTHDLTALQVVAVNQGIAWVFPAMTCKRTSFRAQKAMIADARKTFDWRTLHVDQTGLGQQLAEELVEEFGEAEVKPITFTNQAKEEMSTRCLRWFRDDKIRLPRGKEGTALRSECVALRRKVTPAGNTVFEIPRTGAGHGDRFWALALALKGAGEPQITRGYGAEPLLAVA